MRHVSFAPERQAHGVSAGCWPAQGILHHMYGMGMTNEHVTRGVAWHVMVCGVVRDAGARERGQGGECGSARNAGKGECARLVSRISQCLSSHVHTVNTQQWMQWNARGKGARKSGGIQGSDSIRNHALKQCTHNRSSKTKAAGQS